MKLLRHLDQEDRETDGAVHRKFIGPKLRHMFQERGGYTSSDAPWLELIWKGSNKTRCQCSENSNDVLLKIRDSQGHTGGEVIAPELVGRVAFFQ